MKLSEIERRAEQLWTSYLSGGVDNELAEHDVELLIRAVRQLGVARNGVREQLKFAQVIWLEPPIDPDVLELLEADDEAE